MTTHARPYTTHWGTTYHVTHDGREYTVSALDPDAPYTQVLLHGDRKAPAGSIYPSGAERTTDHYCRRVNPKGKLGRLLIAAAKAVEVKGGAGT
jgi:hypothetical protein